MEQNKKFGIEVFSPVLSDSLKNQQYEFDESDYCRSMVGKHKIIEDSSNQYKLWRDYLLKNLDKDDVIIECARHMGGERDFINRQKREIEDDSKCHERDRIRNYALQSIIGKKPISNDSIIKQEEDNKSESDEEYEPLPESEELAKIMYDAYIESVGKKAFNGEMLPESDEFFCNTKYDVQANGWKDSANTVIGKIGMYFKNK